MIKRNSLILPHTLLGFAKRDIGYADCNTWLSPLSVAQKVVHEPFCRSDHCFVRVGLLSTVGLNRQENEDRRIILILLTRVGVTVHGTVDSWQEI